VRSRLAVPGVAAGVLAVALGLAGCSLVGSSPKPAASSTAPSALGALVPNYPAKLTTATAKSGSVAAADAIQALIASSEIVHVDDHSKLVAATKSTGAFYGVERAVTVTKGLDTIEQAEAMEKLLVQAGWIERAENTSTTAYTVQLTTFTSAGVAALLIEADATVGAPPVILIELESPDLPKK
jgi:hypothetical protein